MGLKEIGLAIFVFAGAIAMTFFSIYVIMADAQWHLGQTVQQVFSIEALNTLYVSLTTERLPWFPFELPVTATLMVIVDLPLIEHAIFGQSPSSYVLWFIGFIFLFLVIAGAFGLVTEKTDLDPLKTLGFAAFVVAGAVITTFAAVYLVTADTAFHFRSISLQIVVLGSLGGQVELFVQLVSLLVIGNWELFEHAQGQSASSYVGWFIGFVVLYIVIAAVLVWISSRR